MWKELQKRVWFLDGLELRGRKVHRLTLPAHDNVLRGSLAPAFIKFRCTR
jgi:hypothetical protein